MYEFDRPSQVYTCHTWWKRATGSLSTCPYSSPTCMGFTLAQVTVLSIFSLAPVESVYHVCCFWCFLTLKHKSYIYLNKKKKEKKTQKLHHHNVYVVLIMWEENAPNGGSHSQKPRATWVKINVHCLFLNLIIYF